MGVGFGNVRSSIHQYQLHVQSGGHRRLAEDSCELCNAASVLESTRHPGSLGHGTILMDHLTVEWADGFAGGNVVPQQVPCRPTHPVAESSLDVPVHTELRSNRVDMQEVISLLTNDSENRHLR